MKNKKKKLANKKPPLKKEMAFRGGGEQGSRTPSAERRTFHVSNGGAPASALLSGSSRRQNDYNIIYKPKQNKNAIIGNDDVFTGPLVDEIPPPDTYSHNSTAKNSVKSAESGLSQKESVLFLSCPYCNSQDFVKRGTRLKKGGKTQLYLCRACKRTFTPVWFKGRQHGWQVILDALSYYHLGFSLEQVSKILASRSRNFSGVKPQGSASKSSEDAAAAGTCAKSNCNLGIGTVQPSTISSWLQKYGRLCAYKRMRPFAVKLFSPYEVVETCTLAHRQLYRFRLSKWI